MMKNIFKLIIAVVWLIIVVTGLILLFM